MNDGRFGWLRNLVGRSPRSLGRRALLICSFAGLLVLVYIVVAGSGSRENKTTSLPVLYDFVENFDLADTQQEYRFIDFGTAAARRFLVSGWAGDQKLPDQEGKETTFVWGLGEKSALQFFVVEPRDFHITFACFPFRFPGSPPQKIVISVNGNKAQEIDLEPRAREYRLVLPGEALVSGKNRIEFIYAYSRAPSEVIPQSTDPQHLAVGWIYIVFGEEERKDELRVRADRRRHTLHLPFGARADYFIIPPQEGILALEGVQAAGEGRGKLEIFVQRNNQEDEQLLATIEPSELRRTIPLPSKGSEFLRISFRAKPSTKTAPLSGGLTLTRPTIQSRSLPRYASNRSKKPNIIIYLIDALRADHLGSYGYKKPVSPRIDEFAKNATIFENAVAQSPWTKPSVASIFTGLCPLAHGVNHVDHSLPNASSTLSEFLRAAGYYTAGFSTNEFISPKFGLSQGFLDFGILGWTDRSDQVNQEVFAWLDQEAREQPFFLYIHTVDPHEPYAAPPSYQERFASQVVDTDLGSPARLRALDNKKETIGQNVTDDIVALYDAEVAFNDNSFGDLVRGLQERGLYENSLIIFVADHGEEFYEHGHFKHHQSLYREVLHIPLLIKFPKADGIPQRSVSSLAQQLDILPTILDYLGIPAPPYVEGQSLLPLTKHEVEEDGSRAAFSYLHSPAHGQPNTPGLIPGISSIHQGDWKLIRYLRKNELEYQFELYNLRKDPLEKKNVFEKHPEIVESLLSLMQGHEHYLAQEADTTVIDDELREQLKAVGYLE